MKTPGSEWQISSDLDFIISSLKSIASYDVENIIVHVSVNVANLTEVLINMESGSLVTSFLDTDLY